jgi:uncharacterized protein
MAPWFKQGEFEGGITAGVYAVLQAIGPVAKVVQSGKVEHSNHAELLQRFDWLVVLGLFFPMALVLHWLRRTGKASNSAGSGGFVGGFGGGWSCGGGYSGGGGFSGGGGSFGGGGASGDW